MSYTVIELDADTAARLRVPIRRMPVTTEAAERLRGPEFDVAGLVDELDRELSAAGDDLARLYAITVARLALAASRRSGRDGFVEAAHHYAEVAAAWAPDDPEIMLSLALTAHEARHFERAAAVYDRALTAPWAADATWTRLMAARAALSAGDTASAQRHLDALPQAADTYDEVWELRAAIADDLALADGYLAVDDLDMRAAPSLDTLPFARVGQGRTVVIDERQDEFARIRRSDGLGGWVVADGLRARPERPHRGGSLRQGRDVITTPTPTDEPNLAAAKEPDDAEGTPVIAAAEPEARPEAEWVYVLEPVEVRDLHDAVKVVGTLQPGNWYAAFREGGEYTHVADAAGALTGWAPTASLNAQEQGPEMTVAEPRTVLVATADAPGDARPPVEESAEPEAEWVYVLDPVEVRDIRDAATVVGTLQPGSWYGAMLSGGVDARVTDADGTLLGWATAAALHPSG